MEIKTSRSSVIASWSVIVFFEMHRVSGPRTFYALHVGYFLGAGSDDFFDFIGSFPVCSDFPVFRSAVFWKTLRRTRSP